LAWWIGVFAGVFEEIGVSAWCFCGQDVVNCVANVDTGPTLFEPLFFCKTSKYFFGQKRRTTADLLDCADLEQTTARAKTKYRDPSLRSG
jgi:hypothetical protein